jgi:ABC-2 type transport system ATP-binding protein
MTDRALRVSDLSKVYRTRRKRVAAVDHVSFDVARGELVGLLGPNGAGKTTTIKCLCTLVRPSGGHMEISGVDVRSRPRRALEKIAAVLEGNRNIYWRLSPRENLEFFSGLQGIPTRRVRPYIDELIDRFRLQEKADVSARMLSRGMQQKLAVACALVKHTDILLLDEPTLGLDVETSYELRDALKNMARKEDRTILLSTHDMNLAQDVCDRVVIIHDGRVVTDDRVANLLDLFRARAYRFRLEGRLSEAQCHKLQAEFELIHLHHTDHASEIEVELLQNEKLYQLMDILREDGSVIESIDRQDPNFEEIFLSIVRGGN